MAQLVPGTSHTRMQATLKAATKGLALFPPGTHMGLWTFSTRLDGGKDYKKVVEIGPLRTNRDEHAAAHSSITPKPHGHTGLYDSILAAYETVRESYDPRRMNSVIVLTDGNNDDPEGIALEGLLSELRSMHDPSRPIPVISIALGPDIDLDPLKKIAKVTQGGAYAAERPSDIGQIFRKAIGARTCRPNCNKG